MVISPFDPFFQSKTAGNEINPNLNEHLERFYSNGI